MNKTIGVIHCADTPKSMDIGAAEIHKWHTDPPRNWSAIGYALVICRDGSVEKGRDLDGDGDVFDEVGAHARGFNRNSIGICLVGGKGGFNFTDAQMDALWVEMDKIEKRFPEIKWVGHNELDDSKECPCFDVQAWRYGK